MIILDAFSSDSIPLHLLTRELPLALYRRKLAPDGVMLFHISNAVPRPGAGGGSAGAGHRSAGKVA